MPNNENPIVTQLKFGVNENEQIYDIRDADAQSKLTNLSNVTNDITTLQAKIGNTTINGTVTQNIAALKTNVDNLNDELDESQPDSFASIVNNKIGDRSEKSTSLTQDIDAATALLPGLRQDINNTSTDLGLLSDDVDAINTQLTDIFVDGEYTTNGLLQAVNDDLYLTIGRIDDFQNALSQLEPISDTPDQAYLSMIENGNIYYKLKDSELREKVNEIIEALHALQFPIQLDV